MTLNSGYEMPIMGLGTYSLSDEECYNSVTALLEAGGRLIDTAYMYHNEERGGRGPGGPGFRCAERRSFRHHQTLSQPVQRCRGRH